MNEKRIIQLTQTPNTINSLVRDFKELGLKAGDLVIAHFSMSKIGWISGGAEAVILALKEVITEEGTIVMPAQSAGNSDPQDWENPAVPKEWFDVIRESMPAYDPKTTQTRGIGVIPELFRTFPNVLRSNHPHASFSALGKLSDYIIDNHELSPMFGINSPLGKLYQIKNAKVLLVGTDFQTCTALHLSETFVYPKMDQRICSAMLIDGKREWVCFDDFDYNIDLFPEIERLYFKSQLPYTKGKVGQANTYLLPYNELIDFGTDYIKNYLKK